MKPLPPLALYRREALRRKQREVADRLRTSQGFVSLVEHGHMPEPWNLERWASEYGLSIRRFRILVAAARTPDLPLFAGLDVNPVVELPAHLESDEREAKGGAA